MLLPTFSVLKVVQIYHKFMGTLLQPIKVKYFYNYCTIPKAHPALFVMAHSTHYAIQFWCGRKLCIWIKTVPAFAVDINLKMYTPIYIR